MLRNEGYLNSIEFKTIREELGLTQSELMRIMNIKNYRTIQRWEKGENVISKQACDTITNLLNEAAKHINKNLDAILERYKRFEFADFVLILYPNDVYQNAAVRKAYCRFIAEGKKAHLIRFNEEDYKSYLELQNLSDSEKNREEWALYTWRKQR